MDYQEEDLGKYQNNNISSNQENSQEFQGEDYSQSQEFPITEGPKKSLWIALFISVFILLFLILFVASMQHDSKNISEKEIIEGEEVKTTENNSIKLRFGEEEHHIKLDFLGINSADLTIESNPIKIHITINETQFVDLNGDGENDLRIKLENIKAGKAILSVKRIDREFCIENWECTDWGKCLNRVKERKCTDLNECGRELPLSKEKSFCVEDSFNSSEFIGSGLLNCSQNNATICNSSQKCNGHLINSSDSIKCCFGGCVSFGLNDSIYSIVCDKEISSFKEASDFCRFFNMSCEEQTIFPALGLIRNFNTTFELQGYTNGSQGYVDGNCLFYYRYENVSINFSNEKFQELTDEGKSYEQINFELQSLNEGFYSLYTGKEIICHYPKNDLSAFLSKWESGKEVWSLDVLGKYNCTENIIGNSS